MNGVFQALNGEPEAALKAVAEFEKAHPKLAGIPYFNAPKINAMLKAKKTAEARKFAEHLIAKAIKSDDSAALQQVSAVCVRRVRVVTRSGGPVASGRPSRC